MIRLDYRDKRPIYEQIAGRLKELMARGILPENTQLPSVRSLAVELSINPNTIQRAYTQLEREGYIYSIKGKGNFAAQAERLRGLKIDELKEKLLDLVDEAHSLGLTDEEVIALIREACVDAVPDDAKRLSRTEEGGRSF